MQNISQDKNLIIFYLSLWNASLVTAGVCVCPVHGLAPVLGTVVRTQQVLNKCSSSELKQKHMLAFSVSVKFISCEENKIEKATVWGTL